MRQQLVPGLPRLGRRYSVPHRIRLVGPLRDARKIAEVFLIPEGDWIRGYTNGQGAIELASTESPGFLARRADEAERQRALFNAETAIWVCN